MIDVRGHARPPRRGTALLVIDLQNDFCRPSSSGAGEDGGVSASRLQTVAANTSWAVGQARGHGIEVIFVQYFGDPEYQGPSWRRRDEVLGKRPKCLEGSHGANFHAVVPRPGEAIVAKRAAFDAFLSGDLEPRLAAGRVGHLVFAGLYTDVCVDSTARTAFQKGFHITVLGDCTAALELPDDRILRFMRRLYGAHIAMSTEVESWTCHPALEETWPA